nr:MAG TPA: hypothetical protein [Caudoviricetes sp.]
MISFHYITHQSEPSVCILFAYCLQNTSHLPIFTGFFGRFSDFLRISLMLFFTENQRVILYYQSVLYCNHSLLLFCTFIFVFLLLLMP